MTADDALNALPAKVNELLITVHQGGMLSALQKVTELLEADEQAGVPISMQRVIAHLRAVAAEADTAMPAELLT